MTSHGFCGFKLTTSVIRKGHIVEFAKQASRIEHVVKAHVVRCETGRYDIILEFGHLAKYKKTPKDLLKELCKISVDGHRVAESVDFCIVQESYQRGERIIEPEER